MKGNQDLTLNFIKNELTNIIKFESLFQQGSWYLISPKWQEMQVQGPYHHWKHRETWKRV